MLPLNDSEKITRLDDRELVELLLQTNSLQERRQLQEEFYNRYARKIYHRCLGIVKNPEEAKDLSHDILVKIFLNLDKYKGSGPLYAWVFAITYNHCINFLEKRKRWRMEELDDRLLHLEGEEAEREQRLLKELRLTRLEHVFDRLNLEDRTILLMYYKDQMPVKTIAAILKIGESAVKMRLKRSRDRLAKLLTKIESHE
ncbi:MAG: sigma-70 family RNA polymerase sigma factor [Bacteroidetes bacterium]|nr:MAG: sigma-70 family RNA polymerase sigma factor [Bacteroidota bacterium]